MMHRVLTVVCVVSACWVSASLSGCAGAGGGSTVLPHSVPQPRETRLFDRLTGPTWKGTLTYRNYSDGQWVSIPSNVRIVAWDATRWTERYDWSTSHTDEPHADSADMVTLDWQQRTITIGETVEQVVAMTGTPDASGAETVVLITEFAGEDDARPATIRKVYTIGAKVLSVQKLVRWDGSSRDFIERHVYRWQRE